MSFYDLFGTRGSISILEDGVLIATAATSIDFTGSGVTVSTVGGAVTVNIPGGISPSSLTLEAVSSASTDSTKSTYTMTSGVPVHFKTSSLATLLYLDETGKVLIGTSTAVGSNKLVVDTSSTSAAFLKATSSVLTINSTADTTHIVLNTGSGAGTTRGYLGASSVNAFQVWNASALNVLANINNTTGTLNILPRSAYTAISDISGLVVGGSGSVTNANIAMGISGSNANIIQSRDGTNNTWALTIQPYGGLLKIGGNTYADGSVLSLGAAISGGYNGTTGSYNARGGASGINRFFVGENNNTSSISVIELRALGSGSSVNPMGRFNVASYLVSGNFTGTSVPIANTTYIDASATGYSGSATGNFVKLSSSEISIIGSTATNTGTRLDSNGFRIDLISNIHTTNSANYSFQVAGGSLGKNVDYSAFKTSGSFNTYQSFGTWDAYGSDSATGQKLAIGGFRSSQWNELNLYTSGSNRMSINTSGNVTISNLAGTGTRMVTADTNGLLATTTLPVGTNYTPTATNVTNVSSSTANNATYTRVGDVVSVDGTIDVTVTSTGATEVDVSLPIASNLANATDLNGQGYGLTTLGASLGVYVTGDTTNDRAKIQFGGLTVGGVQTLYYHFSYKVL